MINNAIDFNEFKGFSNVIGKPIENEIAFKEQILTKYNSHNEKGLTLKGFQDFWRQSIFTEGEATVW